MKNFLPCKIKLLIHITPGYQKLMHQLGTRKLLDTPINYCCWLVNSVCYCKWGPNLHWPDHPTWTKTDIDQSTMGIGEHVSTSLYPMGELISNNQGWHYLEHPLHSFISASAAAVGAYIYNDQTGDIDDDEWASSYFYLITNISLNSLAFLALIPAIIRTHQIPFYEEVMLQVLNVAGLFIMTCEIGMRFRPEMWAHRLVCKVWCIWKALDLP